MPHCFSFKGSFVKKLEILLVLFCSNESEIFLVFDVTP
jgi:hypothetical protein